MTEHTLIFKVIRSRALDTGTDVWVALPEGAPGSVSGDTLAELLEEAEAVKHFVLGLSKDVPVRVEFVFEVPGVPVETIDSYRQARARLIDQLRQAGLSEQDSAELLTLPGGQALRRTA
ncbi:hypothetical protein ABGB17_32060 [Sphaerisporangium sp. B11E5]|uniref:hypothetical protein n=1 Tax=Sphaerisporangium sp. B11E5 TaxID=3153563 RepID=UPI00325E3AA1